MPGQGTHPPTSTSCGPPQLLRATQSPSLLQQPPRLYPSQTQEHPSQAQKVTPKGTPIPGRTECCRGAAPSTRIRDTPASPKTTPALNPKAQEGVSPPFSLPEQGGGEIVRDSASFDAESPPPKATYLGWQGARAPSAAPRRPPAGTKPPSVSPAGGCRKKKRKEKKN